MAPTSHCACPRDELDTNWPVLHTLSGLGGPRPPGAIVHFGLKSAPQPPRFQIGKEQSTEYGYRCRNTTFQHHNQHDGKDDAGGDRHVDGDPAAPDSQIAWQVKPPKSIKAPPIKASKTPKTRRQAAGILHVASTVGAFAGVRGLGGVTPMWR